MEPAGQQEVQDDKMTQTAVASGVVIFTDVQMATISLVVQALLEKALSRCQPTSRDGSGPL